MFFGGKAKCRVCPLLPRAAVVHAVGMTVLTAVERIRERLFANARLVGSQPVEDARHALLAPVGRRDGAVHLVISWVRWQRLREINEVAVEVDVVLRNPRLMREAPGI